MFKFVQVLVLWLEVGTVFAHTRTHTASYPVPTHPPRFSFGSVQVFFHASKDDLYNSSELETLLKASIVQFDKGQFEAYMPGAPFEERSSAAVKQIRDAAKVQGVEPPKFLYYQNLLINFAIFSGMYNQTLANPEKYLLYNTKGDLVYTLQPDTKSNGTFDLTKTPMRDIFVKDCVETVAKGSFDGCFIDRANFADKVASDPHNPHYIHLGWDEATAVRVSQGCKATFMNLTSAVPDGLILSKESDTNPAVMDWPYANAAMTTDTFCSNYLTQAHYNATSCLNDILAIRSYASRGQLTESHGMGPLDDKNQREFTLACFLVGMGNFSYFSYASELKSKAWNIAGTQWWPEFDKPLGEPLGLARRDGMQFTREFSKGTNVTVDLAAHTATIAWGNE